MDDNLHITLSEVRVAINSFRDESKPIPIQFMYGQYRVDEMMVSVGNYNPAEMVQLNNITQCLNMGLIGFDEIK